MKALCVFCERQKRDHFTNLLSFYCCDGFAAFGIREGRGRLPIPQIDLFKTGKEDSRRIDNENNET